MHEFDSSCFQLNFHLALNNFQLLQLACFVDLSSIVVLQDDIILAQFPCHHKFGWMEMHCLAPWIPTCVSKCMCVYCRVVYTEQVPQERARRIHNLWTCVSYDVIDLVEEAVDKPLQYTDQLPRTNPVAAPSCINLKMNAIIPPHAHTTSIRPCILQFVWTRSGLCQ